MIHSIFKSNFNKDFYFSGERHNYWELVYVCDGIIRVTEEDKIYKLKKGDIVFHRPMEFHRLWADDDTAPTVIVICFSLNNNDLTGIDKGVFKMNEELHTLITDALRMGEYCLKFDDQFKNQLIANNLEKLLLTVEEKYTPYSPQKRSVGSLNYKNIVDVLNQNVDKSLSTEDIAELCCLSTSNLKKTFKKYSGMGVMEYYNNLKIARAKEMIITNELNITQISEKLGYSNPNYFSKAFKKECGYTPVEYRKKHELVSINEARRMIKQ